MISYNARNQRIEAWVNAAAEESEDAAPIDPEARDLHDQEKAQRIEHEDLCRENKQPSWHDLVGALSIIIWSLTLIVTVKYCFIVLSADDDGQGGTFALYSLLSRYANIARTDPNGPERIVVRLDRETGADLAPAGRIARDFLERSRVAQSVLKIVGVLGVSMVVADSILTPAQSVLGAVQGIQVIRPDLGRPAIVGTSCAILVALFGLQFFGTSKIGTSFAPVVVVWLLYNLSISIYNLVLYDHTVLKAFSPHYAFTYLIRNETHGWKSLGGLLLAFTGVESLFADLGAFGKRAIQLSWLFLAFPCLLMTYCGQAAFISQDKTGLAYTNPFFRTVPESTLYFSIIIAVLAAVVASQALIVSLNKVPDGGWFALVLSFILSTFFMLWRWGKEQQWEAEQRDIVDPSEFVLSSRSTSRNNSIARGMSGDGSMRSIRFRLSPEFGGGQVMTAPGLGIFFDKVGGTGDHIPKVFTQFIRKFQTRPQVIVFFHMRSLCQPTVPSDQRFVISRVTTKIPSCYRIVLRHGYMDDILTPNLAPIIVNELMTFITRGPFPPDENDMPPEFRGELEALRAAEEAQTVYLMGKQTMRVQEAEKMGFTKFFRRITLEAFLWVRENSRTKLANLNINPDNLVEVGFVKEI
ncbi:hypothetical protein ACHAPO_001683 [Fusarium lateritium]